jgi:hypothetical protein
MNVVAFVALWILVIAGGLPTQTQRVLEGQFPWWHSRLFGLGSSLIEFLCGLGLLRFVLLMSGFGRLGSGKGVLLGALALFLLAEGLLRLAITRRLEGVALPSLPVVIVAKAISTFLRTA